MWTAAFLWWLVFAQLGSGFSEVDVVGDPSGDDRMAVTVEVSLEGSEGPVVAHFVLPGEPEEVISLAQRKEGRWGATTELRRADWTVVFEDVSTAALSEGSTLTELGLDPALLGVEGDTRPEMEEDSSALAAALATFAGLLAMLGVGAAYRRRSL